MTENPCVTGSIPVRGTKIIVSKFNRYYYFFYFYERKEKFECLEKDERSLILIFGKINFRRRYYQYKETDKRVYLLDQFLKLEKRERMLTNVKERLIEEPRETSYRRAGQKASYGTEISKQTVKNEINKIEFKPEKEKKI